MIQEIKREVLESVQKAERYFGESIPVPEIKFDLKGRTAGSSNYHKGFLRFNVPLAVRNKEHFLQNIVPHEVAHWVQRWKYGYGKHCMSHGRQWKFIMVNVMGISPKRCHKYDTSETVTRRLKTYTYSCGCREHKVTSIKHNRIRRGYAYSCTRCGNKLERVVTKNSLTPETL
jgi:SprT protein